MPDDDHDGDRVPDGALRPAAFFDLDKTLIATSAAVAFARPLRRGGLLSRRAMVRAAGAQAAFLLGSATEDRTERVRAQLSAMVAGWEVARVSAVVAESVDEAVEAVLPTGALDLVAAHRAAGHAVVVVSASSEELVRPIATLVGADEVIASRMTVAGGRYTGGIDFYAYGPAKAVAMHALAERRGYDLAASTAYTDSATDAPMLEAVGHGVVVDPDRDLRRLAAERGWEVRTVHGRPLVGTVARLGAAGRRSVAAPGRAPVRLGVGVVLAGVAVGAAAALRRRRHGRRRRR